MKGDLQAFGSTSWADVLGMVRQHRGDYIYFSAAILMPILCKTLAFSVHWSHPQMVDVKIWLWNGEPCWHVLFAKKVIGRLSHLPDVTQYAVSESPLLRPQTALEERSRPRIIGSHVLVF